MNHPSYVTNRIEMGVNEKTGETLYSEERIYLPKLSVTEKRAAQEKYKLCKKNKTTYELTEEIAASLQTHYKFKSIRSEKTQEVWVCVNNVYVSCGKSLIQQYVRNLLGPLYNSAIVDHIVDKIAVDTYIDMDLFFNTPYVNTIVVENGVLNLRTRQLSQDCGNQIHFNRLPVKYDPAAVCPAIDKFYSDIFEHQSDIDTIHEVNGYCLYKDNFLEKAIMMIGDTRNGKTKCIELTSALLGQKNTSKITLHRMETDKSSVHYLFNKLANLAGDISGRPLEDSSTFKALTGRETISSFRKFLDDVESKPYVKNIFATNHMPAVQDDSGFWTKWVILKFPYTFVPPGLYEDALAKADPAQRKYIKLQDPFIISKICTPEELSGLLNRALDGLDRILKNKHFTTNQSATEIQKMWTRKSNSFAAFISDSLVSRANYYITSSDLNTAYHNYCERNGLQYVSNGHIIHKTMLSYFGSTSKTIRFNSNIDRCWTGVRFVNEKSVKENDDRTMFISTPAEIEVEVITSGQGRQDTLK
jgi:putative DNA primase/helicase